MNYAITPDSVNGVLSIIVLFAIFISITAAIIATCHYTAKHLLIKPINAFFTKNEFQLGSSLFKNKVFHRIAYLIPGLFIYSHAHWLDINTKHLTIHLADFTYTLTTLYLIICSALLFSSILNSIHDRYKTLDISIHKPIKTYLEAIKILIYVSAGIFCISYISGKSPIYFFTGLGAVIAVISVIFKDAILGFIASVQLTASDMVRINDWIEMPSYGVDGEVVEISLNTLKVKNFDNTIVTIPTYAVLTSSMKNWRGMTESGGRRIKQGVNIDLLTIKICDAELLKRLSKFEVVQKKINSIKDGSYLTNIGLFRTYLEDYLKNHKEINHAMAIYIRQLQATSTGLPIELYFYTKFTESKYYESIRADIIDHVYAVMPLFDLKPFQHITSFGEMGSNKTTPLGLIFNKYPV